MKPAATFCGACELEVLSADGACPRCGAPVPMPDEAPPVGDAPPMAKPCHRPGVTLDATTRACTLPAGHGGHHECWGDRLWGVDGWGADETADYWYELDAEDARMAGEE